MEPSEHVGNATENVMRLGTYADLSTRVMKRKVGRNSLIIIFKVTILLSRWVGGGGVADVAMVLTDTYVQVLTVTDMFAKHLMCIKLMTPERAKAVVAVYPTMSRYVFTTGGFDAECACISHAGVVYSDKCS